ncbi:hypothetical protein JVU11DRAFT_10897 [Chiua virens]|nr:hypothetical protein JVU11DRAFT_12295 [Chiua virens]KAG9309184.1 hypothetical protein JVU11DRAFT_10897 [Chiua virens]
MQSNEAPSQKKVKVEMNSALPSVRPQDSDLAPHLSSIPGPGASTQGSLGCMYNKDGYIIEVMKKCADYHNKDLPVPVNHHWSRMFISTATLWYSTQDNIWSVPDDKLVATLQTIFNTVYPDVKYRVTTTGGIGSTALIMMVDFFGKLDNDINIKEEVVYLKDGYHFL